MLIVHITTGLGNGGAEGTLYKLVTEDEDNSHSVISLTTGGYYGEKLIARGIPVEQLRMDKTMKGIGSGLLKLRALLLAAKPDIVQTWMYHSDFFGGLVAKSLGIKNVVWNVRSSKPNLANSTVPTWILTRLLALLSHAVPTKIVYCSNSAKKDHKDLGFKEKKGAVIDNGYDPKKWTRDLRAREKIRTELGFGPSTTVIALIARFHPKKNHIGFLKACDELQRTGLDFQVLLVGPSIDEQNVALQENIFATNMRDRVSLLGEASNVAELMSAIDILVMPSLAGEGFPNVVAEAMLCETPCVASSSGDSQRIVGREGWVFAAGSQSDLTDSLRTAITLPPSSLRSIGKSARSAVVENFSQDRMVMEYQELYSLLSRRGSYR